MCRENVQKKFSKEMPVISVVAIIKKTDKAGPTHYTE